jgi:hypothetical protein
LSAGLFLTSDCLSEEKREGTLGLLFLTELRGHDVVLGKLLATSLRGFYGLLAVFPIVAMTQLLGGISGAQYWKSCLALVDALFLSLAAGMLVSALSRDSQKALVASLLVLLLAALGGPLADAAIAEAKQRAFQPLWSLSSPGYLLKAASDWGRSAYWHTLIVTHVLAWGMFALACALVPRTWQERKRGSAGLSEGWAYAWKYGGARRRERLRQKLLNLQPVAWLLCRERWQAQGLWTLAILSVGGFAMVLGWGGSKDAWIIWNYIGGLFLLIVYLWAASQACRFLVEARRSGLLELLLASPASVGDIVYGQWRAWLRMYGPPLLLLLGVHVTASTLSQLSFQHMFTRVATTTTTSATNQTTKVTNQTFVTSVTISATRTTNSTPASAKVLAGSSAQETAIAVTVAVMGALGAAGNLLAICWFGMWMGLTSKSANLATLKTILFVQVIPWFVMAFISAVVMGLLMAGFFVRNSASQPGAFLTWWPLFGAALGTVMALAKDFGFIVWARKRLTSSLREQASRNLGAPRIPPVVRIRSG